MSDVFVLHVDRSQDYRQLQVLPTIGKGLWDTHGTAGIFSPPDRRTRRHARTPPRVLFLSLFFSPLLLPIAGRVGELLLKVFLPPSPFLQTGRGEAAKPCREELEQLRGVRIDTRAFLQQCRIAHTPPPNNQG